MAGTHLQVGVESSCTRQSPLLLPSQTSLNWSSSRFDSLRVIAFETRRAEVMRALIENCGGVATLVPCVREIPLTDKKPVLAFERALRDGKLDTSIFTTEHGTRLLLNNLGDEARPALASTRIVARSPIVASALTEFQLSAAGIAQEPHTWRELLAALEKVPLTKGARVALQEAGLPNRALAKALQTRGVQLVRVPVYRWALPEDLTLLVRAMNNLTESFYDVALFTAATQVWHLFKLAYRKGMEDELRIGLHRVLIASVGPVTSDALREFEIEPDFQASQPTMETLVRETAFVSQSLLARKRQQQM